MITKKTRSSYFSLRLFIALSGFLALILVALLPPSIFRILLAALATGLAPMATTTRRWTPTGFYTANLVLGLPIWGLASVAAWAIGFGNSIPWFVTGLSGISIIVCIFKRSQSLKVSRFGFVDILALIVTALIAAPLLTIWHISGPRTIDGSEIFEARLDGFLDGFYHLGLAQLAQNRETYPLENPVFADAPNRYPALLHCGLGGISSLRSEPVIIAAWPILPVFMLASIPMGFHAVYRLSRARSKRHVMWVFLGYCTFLFLRVDHYLFPQIQSLAFGVLGLCLYYLPRLPTASWSQWTKMAALMLVLIYSHTVSSTVGLAAAACVSVFLLLRKKHKHLLPACLFLAVTIPVYLMLNSYERAPVVDVNVPDKFILSLLKVFVVPFIIPILLGLVIAFKQKPLGPLAAAAFGLTMLTLVYWSVGFTHRSIPAIFFNSFNSSRFAVFGILLLVPMLNYRVTLQKVLWVSLLAYIIVFPVGAVRTIPEMVQKNPQIYPISDVRLIYDTLKSSDKAVLTYGTDFGPPAFSGCPLYVSEASYFGYALGTVDEKLSEQRLAEVKSFFATMHAPARLQYLKQNNIGSVVLKLTDQSDIPRFLPPEAVTVTQGKEWTIFQVK